MIEGMIHILDVDGGNLQVVFSSLAGTDAHSVSGKENAEHFSAQTLGCELRPEDMDRLVSGQPPNAIKAKIEARKNESYFSK
jgi:hypothetical protein